jgi:hypothetical protein
MLNSSGATVGMRSAFDGALTGHGARPTSAAALQWLHMCSLFVLLSVVAAAGMILVDGLTFGASLDRLPGVLFWWVPSVLAIVAAATPVRNYNLRRMVALVLVGVALLVVLDSLGAATGALPALKPAVANGEIREAVRAGPYPQSWVHTLWLWVTGNLAGASEQLAQYTAGHPRMLAVFAISDSSAVFVAVGTLGVVVAVRRWIHENVVFRTNANDLVVGAVLGWIVSPALMILVGASTGSRQAAAFFHGASLLSIYVPSATFAAFGILGFIYALRRAQ